MAPQLNGVKQKREVAERPEKSHAYIGLPPGMTTWLLPDRGVVPHPAWLLRQRPANLAFP